MAAVASRLRRLVCRIHVSIGSAATDVTERERCAAARRRPVVAGGRVACPVCRPDYMLLFSMGRRWPLSPPCGVYNYRRRSGRVATSIFSMCTEQQPYAMNLRYSYTRSPISRPHRAPAARAASGVSSVDLDAGPPPAPPREFSARDGGDGTPGRGSAATGTSTDRRRPRTGTQ